jgi:hypothetical protein
LPARNRPKERRPLKHSHRLVALRAIAQPETGKPEIVVRGRNRRPAEFEAALVVADAADNTVLDHENLDRGAENAAAMQRLDGETPTFSGPDMMRRGQPDLRQRIEVQLSQTIRQIGRVGLHRTPRQRARQFDNESWVEALTVTQRPGKGHRLPIPGLRGSTRRGRRERAECAKASQNVPPVQQITHGKNTPVCAQAVRALKMLSAHSTVHATRQRICCAGRLPRARVLNGP